MRALGTLDRTMNDLAIAAAASADTAYASAPAPDAEKGVPAVIRVLILEDNPNDAALMADTLRRAGIRPEWERVDNVADFTAHLVPGIDLILSDYDLPGLTGLQALELVRSRGLEIPFILVSGSIGEDVAVEAMRKGADDYLLKDRMARLGHAARHAIEKRRLYVDAARAEAAKLESERRFGDMLANVELVSLMLDREARITYVNDFLLRLTGWRRDEVLGANWCELFAPDDTGELQGIFSALLEDRPDARHQEIEIRTRAGGHRLIRWNNTVLRAATGEVIGTASIGEDITERKLQERRIEKLSRIRSLSSEINSAIIRSTSRQALFDAACRIAVVHGKFGIAWIGTYDAKRQEITPVASAGLEDSDFLMREKLVVREDAPQRRSISGIAIRERRPQLQQRYRRGRGSGRQAPAGSAAARLRLVDRSAADGRGRDFRHYVALRARAGLLRRGGSRPPDRSLRQHLARPGTRRAQERLDYLSYYDEITGLPNRALFLDRAGQQLRARGSEMLMVAIILLNVERFRNINETFGRHGGDELLRLVARRLEDAFQGKDYIARVTADGFGVVIRGRARRRRRGARSRGPGHGMLSRAVRAGRQRDPRGGEGRHRALSRGRRRRRYPVQERRGRAARTRGSRASATCSTRPR
jgi:PAS domain S-box-containing protein